MDKAVIYSLYQAADNLRNEGQGATILKEKIERFIQEEAKEEVKKTGITPELEKFRFIDVHRAIFSSRETVGKKISNPEDKSLSPNCFFTHKGKRYHLTSHIFIGGIRKRIILKVMGSDEEAEKEASQITPISLNSNLVCIW